MVLKTGRPSLGNSDEPYLRRWFWEEYGIKSKDALSDTMTMAKHKKIIHPICGFLDNPKWNGIPRIDAALADFLGAEKTEYTATIMFLFMFGSIGHIYIPRIKYDHCLILAGPQEEESPLSLLVWWSNWTGSMIP